MNTSRRRSIASAAAAIAVVAVTGCALIANIGDDEPPYPSDAAIDAADARIPVSCLDGSNVQSDNANCGSCGHACAATSTCVSGSCVDNCHRGVFYVSAAAPASGDGCSQDHPLTTIKAALDLAVQIGTATGRAQEVHVCAGVYQASDTLKDYFYASLYGGYDCATWTRTGTYGYPNFDGRNTTTLQPNAAPTPIDATSSALEVSGPITIDGFRVVASPVAVPADGGSPASAVALSITASGGETIVQNNDIVGASASGGAPLSFAGTNGIVVHSGASTEISSNRINGGGGTGITIEGPLDVVVHDNLIRTDDSSVGGTFAINVSGGTTTNQPITIRSNILKPGRGMAATGIYSNATPMTIVGNVIQATGADCSAPGCTAFGINVDGSSAAVRIAGNRVAAISTNGQSTYGIYLNRQTMTTIENNAIGVASSGPAYGINLNSSTSIAITANTIYANQASILSDSASESTATNNLFLGDSTSGGAAALFAQECPSISAWQNNAFAVAANVADIATDAGGGMCAAEIFASVAALQSALPAARDNVLVTTDCEDASSCAAVSGCTGMDASACLLPALIATWGANGALGANDAGADFVFASLFADGGWSLVPNLPCAIARGGQALPGAGDDSGESAIDLTGTMRSATQPTIGAYEVTTSCSGQ